MKSRFQKPSSGSNNFSFEDGLRGGGGNSILKYTPEHIGMMTVYNMCETL